MDCNSEGIALNRVELVALLSFTSVEKSSRDYYGAAFTVEGDRCYARATDGKKAVEADGTSDKKFAKGGKREWFVYRDFLIACRKLITGNQVARLIFNGASLHEAKFEGVGDDDDGDISTLTTRKDAANAQANIPAIAKQTKLPSTTRDVARCVTLAGPYLATLNKVAKAAATEAIDCYPPKDKDTAAVFRIGDGKETQWTVAIMPVKSVASHEASASTKRNKKSAAARQQGLYDGQGKELDPKTGKPLEATDTKGKGNVSNIADARKKKSGKKAPAKKAAKKPRKKARPRKKAPGKK